MIVRKLRKRHNWSQEQLAELCSLNVRTIQRVENGNKASLETLMALSSVLEVDISTLTKEITVIDKESNAWRSLPWLYRANMFGVGTRRTALLIEVSILLGAFVSWAMQPGNVATPLLFLAAYTQTWIIRYGDEQNIW
jgi:transcriptional regulator with XRE-family HTH domain